MERRERSADELAAAIGDALTRPFLPAAPDSGQCDLCDFRVVCGPYEERRAGRKSQGNLAACGLESVAMTELADAEARRRIREEFGDTLFVEAAAGTGKTTALVGHGSSA